jgi:hypothetical protein
MSLGGLPTILQAVFFAHFIKGMHHILCILIICKQLMSLSMEFSFVAYEAYRALVQAQSPTWFVDQAESAHGGHLRNTQHFAAQCACANEGSNRVPFLSMAQATASRRSATERRARAWL